MLKPWRAFLKITISTRDQSEMFFSFVCQEQLAAATQAAGKDWKSSMWTIFVSVAESHHQLWVCMYMNKEKDK